MHLYPMRFSSVCTQNSPCVLRATGESAAATSCAEDRAHGVDTVANQTRRIH